MSPVTAPPRTSPLRTLVAGVVLVALLGWGVKLADDYLSSSVVPRPADFLQVWSAGQLTLSGGNPYDGEQMFSLQVANRTPLDYASMMWVPPWGLVVAIPIGAMPIGAAQFLWVYGQFALMVALAVVLWKLYGGPNRRMWVAAALAIFFGPLWWQTLCGQYAGLMLLGLVGYLTASRANRPVLAGA